MKSERQRDQLVPEMWHLAVFAFEEVFHKNKNKQQQQQQKEKNTYF